MNLSPNELRGLKALLAEREIRHALERYVRGIDRGHPDLLASAFHEDSWVHLGRYHGRAQDYGAIAREWIEFNDAHMHHILGQTSFDWQNDETVLCETYYCETFTVDGQGQRMQVLSVGRYLDRVERVDDTWLIRVRRGIIDFTGAEARKPPWPSLEEAMHGKLWPEDAVYRFDDLVTMPE